MPYSYGRYVRILGAILLCAILLHPGSTSGQPLDKLDPTLKRLSFSNSFTKSTGND